MNDILRPQNTKFKLKQFEDKLKRDMLAKWIEEFETMWEARKLGEQLTTLNSLKQEYKQNGSISKAWLGVFLYFYFINVLNGELFI